MQLPRALSHENSLIYGTKDNAITLREFLFSVLVGTIQPQPQAGRKDMGWYGISSSLLYHGMIWDLAVAY